MYVLKIESQFCFPFATNLCNCEPNSKCALVGILIIQKNGNGWTKKLNACTWEILTKETTVMVTVNRTMNISFEKELQNEEKIPTNRILVIVKVTRFLNSS